MHGSASVQFPAVSVHFAVQFPSWFSRASPPPTGPTPAQPGPGLEHGMFGQGRRHSSIASARHRACVHSARSPFAPLVAEVVRVRDHRSPSNKDAKLAQAAAVPGASSIPPRSSSPAGLSRAENSSRAIATPSTLAAALSIVPSDFSLAQCSRPRPGSWCLVRIRDMHVAKPDPIMHCRRQRKHLPDSSPHGGGLGWRRNRAVGFASFACGCRSGFLPGGGLH
jgi:hypothetical protein